MFACLDTDAELELVWDTINDKKSFLYINTILQPRTTVTETELCGMESSLYAIKRTIITCLNEFQRLRLSKQLLFCSHTSSDCHPLLSALICMAIHPLQNIRKEVNMLTLVLSLYVDNHSN